MATPLKINSSNAKVKVFVRTRPLLPTEKNDSNQLLDLRLDQNKIIINDGSEKAFSFDGIFDCLASQEEIFQKVVAPLIVKVKEGYNATVLAYGQTGSGKTFTIGTNPTVAKSKKGLYQLALDELFNNKDNNDVFFVKLSFFEIYNEILNDLLSCSRRQLQTKPDGVTIIDATEELITTTKDGCTALEQGCKLRSVGRTALNIHSSRSHAIISLKVFNEMNKKCGCLKLVDLAGAEGVGKAQMVGQQFNEGVAINKGLLALGKVLSSLSSNTISYVPYRDSLLTRILRTSLGGSSMSAMISCINPLDINISETINTLRCAEKHSGTKRRFVDVTASPGRSVRRCRELKYNYNSTVSTPGHKPPINDISTLNFTMDNSHPEPLSSTMLLHDDTHSCLKNDFALSVFPLSQPVFENLHEDKENISSQDCNSFSGVKSHEKTILTKSTVQSLTPVVEKISSRLEQTLMDGLADRVADQIFKKFGQNENDSSLYKNSLLYSTGDAEKSFIFAKSLLRPLKMMASHIFEGRESNRHGNGNISLSKTVTTDFSQFDCCDGNRDITVVSNCGTTNIEEHNVSGQLCNKLSNFDSFVNNTFVKPSLRRSTRRSSFVARFRNQEILSTKRLKKVVVSSVLENRILVPVASPKTIKAHNSNILKILNSDSIRHLQQLPTVGPKTSWIIFNFRKLYGNFKTLGDLKSVYGLPKHFFARFEKANLGGQQYI